MDPNRASAVASLLAALVVVIASNKQCWTISFNGVMVTRLWARRMLLVAAGWLLTALVLLVLPVEGRADAVAIGGVAMSVVMSWPLGGWLHRIAVARFLRENPGLAGSPLGGGQF